MADPGANVDPQPGTQAALPRVLLVDAHLPQLFRKLVYRLRFPINLGTRAPVSAAHGLIRPQQGHTAAMLVEESRMLQVTIYQTTQDTLKRIDSACSWRRIAEEEPT